LDQIILRPRVNNTSLCAGILPCCNQPSGNDDLTSSYVICMIYVVPAQDRERILVSLRHYSQSGPKWARSLW